MGTPGDFDWLQLLLFLVAVTSVILFASRLARTQLERELLQRQSEITSNGDWPILRGHSLKRAKNLDELIIWLRSGEVFDIDHVLDPRTQRWVSIRELPEAKGIQRQQSSLARDYRGVVYTVGVPGILGASLILAIAAVGLLLLALVKLVKWMWYL